MNNETILTALLDTSAYTILNHGLILGLDGDLYEAFLLARLISLHTYFSKMNMLTEEGWFFQTVDDVLLNCGISDGKQRRALQDLQSKGMISMKLMGSPPRRFFKIHADAIVGLLEAPEPTTIPEPLDKTSFYEAINSNITNIWDLRKAYYGNIPEELAYFMHVWSRSISMWKWTPKQYGILRNYWRNRYGKKKFDFECLFHFLAKDTPEEYGINHSLYDFIEFDRRWVERDPELRRTYDFLFKGEKW